jgi:ssDNA-binding Zn-finger/Zn-ribbon topoisomerase 1
VKGCTLITSTISYKIIKCPKCGSEAINRYGKISSGKKRFICLVCGRQFVVDSDRYKVKNRPSCPKCGKKMHCYKRNSDNIRFRCSAYPDCKTYLSVPVVGRKSDAKEQMISPTCDFKLFMKTIKSKDIMEVVYLTEQEATKAERLALKPESNPKQRQKCSDEYSVLLKGFIKYIRFAVKPKLPEDHEYRIFTSSRNDLQA